jgi:carboxymethylenebutenolidase
MRGLDPRTHPEWIPCKLMDCRVKPGNDTGVGGTTAMAIKTTTVMGPERYGYLAEPVGGARSGVVLLPTIFAINAFARNYADTLANAGLACAVWDINSGLPLPSGYEEAIARARALTDDAVVASVGKWIDHMLGEMKLQSIGVLGFCIGGRFAIMQAATDKRIGACAMAYPSIENPRLPNQAMDSLKLAADIACPVLNIQPGEDHVSEPETYQILNAALLKRTAPTTLQYYPVAEHGFMHRPQPEANVAATTLASPQLLAFLTTCLR